MKTLYLLLAMYDGRPILPVEVVCRDFFGDLSTDKFLRKVSSGEIALSVMRRHNCRTNIEAARRDEIVAAMERYARETEEATASSGLKAAEGRYYAVAKAFQAVRMKIVRTPAKTLRGLQMKARVVDYHTEDVETWHPQRERPAEAGLI